VFPCKFCYFSWLWNLQVNALWINTLQRYRQLTVISAVQITSYIHFWYLDWHVCSKSITIHSIYTLLLFMLLQHSLLADNSAITGFDLSGLHMSSFITSLLLLWSKETRLVTENTSAGRLRLDFPEWRCRSRLDDTARLDPDSVAMGCLSASRDMLRDNAGSDLPANTFTRTAYNNDITDKFTRGSHYKNIHSIIKVKVKVVDLYSASSC